MPSSYSIFRIICIYLLHLLIVTSAVDIKCAKVKYAFSSKGLYDSTEGENSGLRDVGDVTNAICIPEGKTCCTVDMEHKLSRKVHSEMDITLRRNMAVILSRLARKTIKFDSFFQDLLVKAKTDFHELFLKTYGITYRQNSHVALRLFDDLLAYYKGGDPDLSDVLDGFFVRLYETMFTVMHRQYNFDEKHLVCMRSMMGEIQPFGNVPRRLSAEIKRAFVASRIFVQALAVGSNVIKKMMQIGISKDCTRALMKMSYCPQCHGYMDLKPCNNYCLNVMKGCLAYHSELNPVWEEYIAKMIKMSVRLEDAFNIEDVVNPINLEISHAIMNFQENSRKISEMVTKKCGEGNISRGKRSVVGEIKHETYKFSGRDDFKSSETNSGKASGIGLKNHITLVRKDMKILKSFWKNLSLQICNSDDVATKRQDDCWNGNDKARYDQTVSGDGLLNQSTNPEVPINVGKQNSQVNDLIVSLKLTILRLGLAHDGVYVKWTGSELSNIDNLELDDLLSSKDFIHLNEQFEEKVSEGSGSGDGDDCTKNDDCDDDDTVSTFTISDSNTSTEMPKPLTTSVFIEETSRTTAQPSATTKITDEELFIECEGSGCSSGSGDDYSNNTDEPIYVVHVSSNNNWPPPNPTHGKNNKPHTNNQEETTIKFSTEFSTEQDLYFQGASSSPDLKDIEEMEEKSNNIFTGKNYRPTVKPNSSPRLQSSALSIICLSLFLTFCLNFRFRNHL